MEKQVINRLRSVGHRALPEIFVFQSVQEIPSNLGGSAARAAVQSGSVVDAMHVVRRVKGQLARAIVIVREGAEETARDRKISLHQRVDQLALHEIVHDTQTLGALFPPQAQSEYHIVVEGVLSKLKRADSELWDHLTASADHGGYGFDPSTAAGRFRMAEEYLARFHERQNIMPDWAHRAIAEILRLLRKAHPDIPWTDSDLRALLNSARRKVKVQTLVPAALSNS